MVTRILCAAVALSIAAPSIAHANSVCADRTAMVSKLKKKYGEAERGMGLSGTKAMIEVWSSKKTGTFTIMMTRPDGTSCVVAAGDSWMDAPPEMGPET